MKIPISSFIVTFVAAAIPNAIYAADVTVESTTMVRFRQVEISSSEKQDLRPATQFLGLDATKLANGNLSLHIHGWGRADLGDTSYGDNKTAGDLSYAYLRYRLNDKGADIRAGRLFVRDGIVNEHLDGISARANLPYGFTVSTFAGATVHTQDLKGETSDGKGDYLVGGRFGFRSSGILDIGVSAVYEDDAPKLLNYSNGNNRKVGGDIWFSPHKSIELLGHTSYNTETSEIAEHSYLVNLRPANDLIISGEFSDQRDQSLLYTWALFSSSMINPNDMSRIYGLTVSYAAVKPATIDVYYKHYDREIGTADRYGSDLKFSFKDNAVRAGLGYSYLDADSSFAITGTSSSASFHNIRAYTLHDTNSYFASLDLNSQLFDKKLNNERGAYEANVSLGYHFTPMLAISGDISYGKNPDNQNETKGLVRLTYNTTFEPTGGKK